MKKIIIFTIVMILLISSASAFLERKSQIGENKFRIYDNLIDHKLDVELLSNTYMCFIDCEAVIIIDPDNPFTPSRDNDFLFEFFNLKGGLKDYHFEILTKTIYEKTIDDYGLIKYDCSYLNNKTLQIIPKICEKNEITGNHKEKREVWSYEPFDYYSYTFTEETIIRLIGKKGLRDKIEWIPNFYGIKIDEWAIWELNATFPYQQNYSISYNATNGVDLFPYEFDVDTSAWLAKPHKNSMIFQIDEDIIDIGLFNLNDNGTNLDSFSFSYVNNWTANTNYTLSIFYDTTDQGIGESSQSSILSLEANTLTVDTGYVNITLNDAAHASPNLASLKYLDKSFEYIDITTTNAAYHFARRIEDGTLIEMDYYEFYNNGSRVAIHSNGTGINHEIVCYKDSPFCEYIWRETDEESYQISNNFGDDAGSNTGFVYYDEVSQPLSGAQQNLKISSDMVNDTGFVSYCRYEQNESIATIMWNYDLINSTVYEIIDYVDPDVGDLLTALGSTFTLYNQTNTIKGLIGFIENNETECMGGNSWILSYDYYEAYVSPPIFGIDSSATIVNTAPTKPSLNAPSNDTLITNNNIVFNWSKSIDFDGDPLTYNCQLANDTSFTLIVFENSTINNTADIVDWELDITSLGNLGTYYWRCRGNDGTVNGSYSDFFEFYRSTPPTTPLLLSPLNNTKFTTLPILTWINSTDAEGNDIIYSLQVATNYGFTNVVYGNGSIPETINPTQDISDVTLDDIYYWRVNATDTGSWSDYSEVRQFELDNSTIKKYIIDYETNTTEGDLSNFYLNVTYNDLKVNIVNATLVYDNTSYATTERIVNTTTKDFISTITLPSVVGEQDKTFYWNISGSLFDSTRFTNHTHNSTQTISGISFFECDGTFNDTQFLAYNFTFNEESNNTKINETNIKANFVIWTNDKTINDTVLIDSSSTGELDICVSPITTSYNADAVIEYEKTDYDKRFYYLSNNVISANTSNSISLYLLDSTRGDRITVYVQDSSGIGVDDVLVYVQRYYTELDSYINVVMARTNDDGEDDIDLRKNDVIYRFVVVQDESTAHTSFPSKIFDDTITLTIAPETLEDILGEFDDTIYTFEWNNDTKYVVLTWTVTSGLGREFCLRCNKITPNKQSIVYDACSTSSSGTLMCYLNETAEYSAIFYGEGDITHRIAILEIIVGQWKTIASKLGLDGIAYTLLLSGTLAGFGLAMGSGIMAIGGVVIGVVSMSIIGFIKVSYSVIIGLVIVSLIAIIRLRGRY